MQDEPFSYCITTESAADLGQEQLALLHARALPLEYRVGTGKVQADGPPDAASEAALDAMKNGVPVSVAMAGTARFLAFWTPELRRGRDILHLALSSGLGGTCLAAVIAAAECKRRFPARRIFVVDTLAASGGLALLVFAAAKARAEGMEIDLCRAHVEEKKRAVQHLIACADLAPLVRSGLIAPCPPDALLFGAYAALSLDAAGRLAVQKRFLDRTASLRFVRDRYLRTRAEGGASPRIVHTGCPTCARQLAGLIETAHGGDAPPEIALPGAVTCARIGPGAVGLFYFGRGRI